MNWNTYWKESTKNESNKFKQVQRTKQGVLLTSNELNLYVEYLSETIELGKGDFVLDLCCGNGLITDELAPKCAKITGVDFTQALIDVANNHLSPNQQYICSDVQKVHEILEGKFDKIILLFSLQYFTIQQLETLIGHLIPLLNNDGVIFFSDIPNIEKQGKLSGTGLEKLKYKVKYLIGKDQTGKFWSKAELDNICANLNLQGQFINQPSELPYADYRFDYLIKKS